MFLRVAIQEDVEDVQVMVQGVPHLFSLVLQDDELQDALRPAWCLPPWPVWWVQLWPFMSYNLL